MTDIIEKPVYFIRAAAMGDLCSMRQFITRKSWIKWCDGVDVKDPIGCTALHAAIRNLTMRNQYGWDTHAETNIVSMLLNAGANPSVRAYNGNCADTYFQIFNYPLYT